MDVFDYIFFNIYIYLNNSQVMMQVVDRISLNVYFHCLNRVLDYSWVLYHKYTGHTVRFICYLKAVTDSIVILGLY